jgi:hypothetical protein
MAGAYDLLGTHRIPILRTRYIRMLGQPFRPPSNQFEPLTVKPQQVWCAVPKKSVRIMQKEER